MERAAVRDGAARRAMIVPGALLTAARTAEYVDAAIEDLKPPPDSRQAHGRRRPARPGARWRLDGGRAAVLRGRDEAGGPGAEGPVKTRMS
jgi:hypothetical protein